MTKKEKTIKACKVLIERYKHPSGHKFFNSSSCPLCTIHYICGDFMGCSGCPLSDKDGNQGCNYFETYKKAHTYYLRFLHCSTNDVKEAPKVFIDRAKFFEKIIPILKKIPEKRFTKKGWVYFSELNRSW